MRLPLFLALPVIGLAAPAAAQQLVEVYDAQIGPQDQVNSQGVRLTTAAAIIRQDRANFHRFGLRDPGDGGDSTFASADNRAALEQMLARGGTHPVVFAEIVNGRPRIHVEVWRDRGAYFVKVSLL